MIIYVYNYIIYPHFYACKDMQACCSENALESEVGVGSHQLGGSLWMPTNLCDTPGFI